MAYKMNGFSGFKSSPAKQKSDTTKTYPKSYTKEDIEFLKEQREDVVRYEDLDEKGKAIWRKNNQQLRSNPDTTRIKKKSPAKQEGPIDEKQMKLQPSEHKDTYVTKDKSKRERVIDLEDRIEFIDEDAWSRSREGKPSKQQKKDKAKLQQELAILRKSKH